MIETSLTRAGVSGASHTEVFRRCSKIAQIVFKWGFRQRSNGSQIIFKLMSEKHFYDFDHTTRSVPSRLPPDCRSRLRSRTSSEWGCRRATRNDPPPSAVKRSGMEMGERNTISRGRSAFPSEFCRFIDWPFVV